MSARFTLGRNKDTRETINIRIVDPINKHNFVCPQCDKQLTCVLNVLPDTKHFKHRVELGCNATSETLLHLAIKEILTQNTKIKLPSGLYFDYSEALPEKKWDKYRPDVTLNNNEKTLYIEVVVSHRISWEKKLRFNEKMAECLVLDFSNYDREFNINLLKADVLESLEFKSMLLNTKKSTRFNLGNDNGLGFMLLVGAVGAGIAYVGYNEFIRPLIKKRKFK
nr:hypothetical protein [uncultured Pedobacter sp.]